jgi:hypothetical protein
MLNHVCQMECAEFVYVYWITGLQLCFSLIILSYLAIQEEIQFLITEKCCFTSVALPSIAQSPLCHVRNRYEVTVG